ncbi:hypothetical protein [Thalassobaculum sp.]|uniref:hypothetical protein n=1 Tax=Thalassobaculum sp. TaxID=2022740 RepID=UPI0032EE0B93
MTPPWQLLLYALASLFLGASPLLVAVNGPDIMAGIYVFFTAPVGFLVALWFGLLAVLRMLGGLPNKGRSTSGRR